MKNKFIRLAKRATARKIPYFLAYESLFTVYLWFWGRFTLYQIWWFLVIGFSSLAFLLLLEGRQNIPFPFTRPLSKSSPNRPTWLYCSFLVVVSFASFHLIYATVTVM